jgi:hypothetical protein
MLLSHAQAMIMQISSRQCKKTKFFYNSCGINFFANMVLRPDESDMNQTAIPYHQSIHTAPA